MQYRGINANFYNSDLQKTVKELFGCYQDLNEKLPHMLSNLDEENVVRAKSVVADWVYAGKLEAEQIKGGTISGVTVNVDTDITVGNNVIIGKQDSLNKKIHLYNNDNNSTYITIDSSGKLSIITYGDYYIGNGATYITVDNTGMGISSGYEINIGGGQGVSLSSSQSVTVNAPSFVWRDETVATQTWASSNFVTSSWVSFNFASVSHSHSYASESWVLSQINAAMSAHVVTFH